MNECGIISGYVVHPAADVFPLLQGDDFDHLVESIVKNGVQHPIVVWRGHDGDVLIDGRNRLRAAEEARRLGHDVAIPVTEWKDDGRNVAEWIWDTNARRRQMTEDGIALASAAIAPLIAKENEARQAATKFDSEKASKAAKARHAVDTKTDPPQKRDAKQKNARSTVGQVAAKAGTSIHKARQAVAVQKAIEAGALPAQAAQEVMAGKKRLRDVAPKPKKGNKPATRDFASIDDEIRVQAHRAWSRLRDKFTPGDEHKKLRAVMLEIIRNEQKSFAKK
jgi:ParB-like chromosome segregation protein Spo0J